MFTFLLTNLYARLETLWFPICVRLKSVNSVGFFGDELDSLDLSKKYRTHKGVTFAIYTATVLVNKIPVISVEILYFLPDN